MMWSIVKVWKIELTNWVQWSYWKTSLLQNHSFINNSMILVCWLWNVLGWLPGMFKPLHHPILCLSLWSLPEWMLISSTLIDCDRASPTLCTVLHCTELQCTKLHCTKLDCTELHCNAVHCTLPNCTAFSCSALHCTALHCTEQHCSLVHHYTILYWNKLL